MLPAWEDSFLLSKPQRNREPVSDSQVPHVQILLTVEVSPVACEQAKIVFEVVIDAGIEARVRVQWIK